MPTFIEAMRDADFIFIDGNIFKTRYLRIPDETTQADDIILEAQHEDTEVELTRFDIDQAIPLEAGFFRLKNGMVVRFIAATIIH
ncbi:MAG: hypothetical protein LBS40_06645 [Burkholderiales bacterium]|jgi:hypothetical protein|nr:hypothetical protein [Burkholderiales bacterium]